MVVDYYKSLVAGLKSAGDLKTVKPPTYRTDLSANVVAFNLTGYLSIGCAGLMLMEQYAQRRLFCVGDTAPSTSEYCWHHGTFKRNSTMSTETSLYNMTDMLTIRQSWVLQMYLYFLIRAFFFMAPHLLWQLKFHNSILALLHGTCDIISDLEEAWIGFAESAQDEIRKAKMTDIGVDSDRQSKAGNYQQMAIRYGVTNELTRNVNEMTKARMSDYHAMLRFTGLRMAYDIVIHSVFLFFDVSILLTIWNFDGTDFYCTTPWNSQNLRCMTPMLQILQQVMLLNLLCGGFVWLVMFGHTISLTVHLTTKDTSSCFIESIPFADPTIWATGRDRRTYKLMSIYLLQNFVILHPLGLLKTFVTSLKKKGLAGPQFINNMKREMASAPTTTRDIGPPLGGAVMRDPPLGGAVMRDIAPPRSGEVHQRKISNPQLSLYDDHNDGERVWLQSTNT